MIQKLRVWDKQTKSMWNIERWHIEDEYFDLIEPNKSVVDLNAKRTLRKQRDVSLKQSTGQFDNNDKEIFEGDIVHAYSEGARLIGVIEYFDNAYCIKDKNGIYNSLWINTEHYEVVGNIYQNKESVEE